MLAVPSALKRLANGADARPSTIFGGARNTNARSTSAMASSSRDKGVERRGVARAELGHGLLGAAFAGEEIAAVGRRQEILRAALDDPQAVIGQLQIADDLRVEQADGVGRDRVAKAGVEFLRDRGAADHLAALDHLHAQSGHRQIGRAGEAVMAGSDDDDVSLRHGSLQEGLISVTSGRVMPRIASP